MNMRTLLMGALVVAMSACQCGGGSGSDGGTGGDGGGSGGSGGGMAEETPLSIDVTPKDAMYTTDGVAAVNADYTATATYAGGRTEDITAKATFGLADPGLGYFQTRTFKSTIERGGRSTVTASLKGVTGSTSLTLLLKKVILDPGSMNLPTDPASKFTKTPVAGREPDIVYPNDGVLLPPNLGKLEVHFMPGNNNQLFELSMLSTYTDVKVYLRCTNPMNGGCIYMPDATAWKALATANRGGGAVQLTLKGTDDNGDEVGVSGSISLNFSQDEIQGGLYYWSTTAQAIMRFDFASPTQVVAEKYADGAITGGQANCIGCHALSRDGKKMVIEAEGSTDGRLAILDVATKTLTTPFPAKQKSFFESWNPDSTAFVGVDDRGTDFNLRIFNGTDGELVQSIAGTGDQDRCTDHPDWSADGNTIAYSSVTRNGPRGVSLQWPTKGAVRMVKKNGNDWSAPVEIAPWVPGKNRYYPAIAPSNEYLVFNESNCNQGSEADINCDADTDPDAKLYAAKLEANATMVELVHANQPGKRDNGETKLSNSFPKWSPFNFQRTGEVGSRLQWVTFSSWRKYGLRNPDGKTWLWMVAVDPDKVLAGQDGSYPAFCLPFQDLATSNHIAQWATVVVGTIN